jgi:hypothetical protein
MQSPVPERNTKGLRPETEKEPDMTPKNYKVTYGATQEVEEANAAERQQMDDLINASLCANCRHQSDCSFLPKACVPILECELYECGRSERPRLMVVKKTCAAAPTEEVEAPLGLCMNCENLQGCNLPKPQGGVWMCEEYR